MNELMIKDTVQAPVIAINFDELEAQAQQIAQAYTSVAITDDTYMSAKADAKKLGGYVNDIEKRRKALKAQVEAPIKEFDAKCKAIEKILTDAKAAIEGVTVKYDEDRKKDREDKIKSWLDKEIGKTGLRQEFINRLVTPANLQNLSSTLKSIKEDYSLQISNLKTMQDNFDAVDAAIKASVDTGNAEISQKMDPSMFVGDMNRILDSGKTLPEMLTEINSIVLQKAQSIKEAEEKIRQEAIEAERRKQEEEEKAYIAAQEEAAAEVLTTQEEPVVKTANANVAPTVEPVKTETNPFQSNPFTAAPQWEGTISLTGTSDDLGKVLEEMKKLCAQYNVKIQLLSSHQV